MSLNFATPTAPTATLPTAPNVFAPAAACDRMVSMASVNFAS
jgi:hypothetical protein